MKHRIRIEGADQSLGFDCAEDQSVLDAALRAGIELPYSCRKGVCGNCAGRLAAGEIAALGGAPLRNELCEADQLLYCTCAPRSELLLRPASWRKVDPSARKSFVVRVFGNELAAPEVSVLKLRLPAGQRAKFQAGQYLQILLDDGSARCYSMANPPQESDALTLHVRHIPGGRFSSGVAALQPGDTLKITLPFGNVALAPEDTRPIVLVAGGTGFAPVKSILDDMVKRRVQRPITLIRGAREPAGLYLPAAVEKWQQHWPQMRYVPALSRAPADGPTDAYAGRVDGALRACCPALEGHVVYCCGSPQLVADVRSAALDAGLAAQDFHADVFVPGSATST